MKSYFWYLAAIFLAVSSIEPCCAMRLAGELLDGSGYNAGQILAGMNGGFGWDGAWRGASNGLTVQPMDLTAGGIQAVGKSIHFGTTTEDRAIFRGLKQQQGVNRSTVWISFTFKKLSGNRWCGLSCFNDSTEKLFVGVLNGGDNIHLGIKGASSVSALYFHQAVVRIDYQGGHDSAYLFLDPNPASVPDTEGANAVVEGSLAFNSIRIAAGGSPNGNGVSGTIGPILIGTEFADVVNSSAKIDEVSARADDKLNILSWEKRDGALWITTSGGILKLQPFLDHVLQVQFGTEAGIKAAHSYAVQRKPALVDFSAKEKSDAVILKAPNFSAKVLKATSQISIYDAIGKLVLEESPQGARHPVKDDSVAVTDCFQLTPTEAIYGLGQYRDRNLSLRGKRRELVQVNTQVTVPVLLSVNGWGMFWENPSRTVFMDNTNGMSFTSDFGNVISYYVFIGQRLDDLIAQYRQLTGVAPMPPLWALGYHQSRNRYRSGQEVLSTASRMRTENIPLDSIFIDYFYWGKYGIGSHHFDESQFPDATKMINQLHELHTKTIVTVWPTFKSGTSNYTELHNAGLLLEGATALGGTVYDPFNPKSGAVYWRQIKENLVPLGIDGWFLDGPEPDNVASFLRTKTFVGPAPQVRNLYPLVHTSIFYNGLRAVYPNQRIYIITRSGWASQQRNSTVVWSGDISSTFDELKTQITAGLGFVATGIPYWTTDVGGYSGGNPADPAYRETYVRWWEYGTFCPIFRSHGRRNSSDTITPGSNELWSYGTNIEAICIQFSNLRYRLLPYIYSMSGDVTQNSYTPMRLLAFDFPDDPKVYDLKDQFMYGPALLINPVTTAGATNREVYLPGGNSWIDFWTGQMQQGGQKVIADAPINKIPIFVRAGSIVPMGSFLQYTDEKPSDPIELRVYRGANAMFELYEDDGKTFDYEKGQSSRIRITWDESSQALTIGPRQGVFAGMLKNRTFNIVWVSQLNGSGISESKVDTVVNYNGSIVSVHLPANGK